MKRVIMIFMAFGLFGYALVIDRSYMAMDAVKSGDTYDVKGIVDNYPVDKEKLYAIVFYKNADAGDVLHIKWIAEKAEGGISRYEIATVDLPLALPSGAIRAQLQRGAKPWPKGTYRVEMYHKDKKVGEHTFTIGMGKTDQNASNPKPSAASPITDFFFAKKAWHDKEGYIDYDGKSDRFDVTQHKLFVIVKYRDLTVPGTIQIQWVLDDADGNHNALLLKNDMNITQKEGALYFAITLDIDWPVGSYHAELYHNDRRIASAPFKMAQSAPASVAHDAPKPAGNSDKIQGLIGSKWVDNSEAKPLIIYFPSSTQMSFDGVVRPCIISDTRIKMHGQHGWLDILYTISGDEMTMTMVKTGAKGVFHRMKSSGDTPAATPNSQNGSPTFAHRYCSSRGSSNEWIAFGASGDFSFGSLENDIVAASGTYRVTGDTITVTVKGEDLGALRIIRKSGTQIETLEFDGTVYDSKLCPAQKQNR